MMFAGAMVKRESVVRTFLVADFTTPVPVGGETFIVRLMLAAASGANFGIVYGFDNILGTKHFYSTVPAEWIMVRYESFDGAERTGFFEV